jgi:hypothetical protein
MKMAVTEQEKALIRQPYLVAPPHQYFKPFPPGGTTALSFGTIQAGNLIPLPYNQLPIVLPEVQMPPSGALFFRFAPGVAARQIQQGSYRCRKIIFYAPGPTSIAPNAASIFVGTQGVAYGGATSMEVPPGGSGVWEISDVTTAWFIAANPTDIITGWAESIL